LASLQTEAANYFIMSTENETVADADEVCSSCGIAEVDDVKLQNCACGLVKYCSVACQKNHGKQHGEECKKRSAELRGIKLFTQPDESHLGECPICCLPLPIDNKKYIMATCCSKRICKGCDYANQKREYEAGLQHRCSYCREPVPKSKENVKKNRMKRFKKNCPVALGQMGFKLSNEGDYETAFKYYAKAAESGDANAHYNLSILYGGGQGVEMDKIKELYHLEEAAIAGHPEARYNLGCEEYHNCRYERAKKHFIIAANLGLENSLKCVKGLYADGHASKEEYTAALRTYQAAVEATKSTERDVAEAYYKSVQEE
jgi:tetratricopeptide (TPR) repeat protein